MIYLGLIFDYDLGLYNYFKIMDMPIFINNNIKIIK